MWTHSTQCRQQKIGDKQRRKKYKWKVSTDKVPITKQNKHLTLVCWETIIINNEINDWL